MPLDPNYQQNVARRAGKAAQVHAPAPTVDQRQLVSAKARKESAELAKVTAERDQMAETMALASADNAYGSALQMQAKVQNERGRLVSTAMRDTVFGADAKGAVKAASRHINPVALTKPNGMTDLEFVTKQRDALLSASSEIRAELGISKDSSTAQSTQRIGSQAAYEAQARARNAIRQVLDEMPSDTPMASDELTPEKVERLNKANALLGNAKAAASASRIVSANAGVIAGHRVPHVEEPAAKLNRVDAQVGEKTAEASAQIDQVTQEAKQQEEEPGLLEEVADTAKEIAEYSAFLGGLGATNVVGHTIQLAFGIVGP